MKKLTTIILILAALLMAVSCGEAGERKRAWYPYDLSEYVVLEDWHGVKAVFDDPTVCTEEEIDEAIFQVMLTYATFDHKDGAAELYDNVRFNYYVYFGEELLDDYSTSDYEIILGSASLSDMDVALANSLIGAVPGDSCGANYTFPDSGYLYGSLANKTVLLVAEVSEIYAPTIPECDEEFVQGLSGEDFHSVDEFRDAVREDILAQKVENRIYAVWGAFSASAQILKYPERELKAYQDDYMSYYKDYAEEYKLDLDEFLREYFNSSEEDFRQEAKEYAESMVKNDLIFTQLSRLMGTTLSEKEYEEGVQAYYDKESASYDSQEAYIEHYGEEVLRENLIWDKSLRAMAEVAVRIEDEPAAETATHE